MKNSMTHNYVEALRLIVKGMVLLAVCLCHTMVGATEDAMRYAVKHPIAMGLNVCLVAGSMIFGMTARAERDSYGRSCYTLEQQRDSLQLIADSWHERR